MTAASTAPLVTVLIPARNEGADLADCLDAVAKQDHPHDRLEIVVVDGASSDDTLLVAERKLAGFDLHRAVVVSNPLGSTPTSLNVGLRASTGDIVCRVDARSLIPPDYVRRCAVLLAREDVAVVGGAQVAEPRRHATATARGIARALRNPYVTGFARYRRRAGSGPTDTVYLGAFRRSDLQAVGGWDERFATNQDFELNRRLAHRGVIWFEHTLEVAYRPRSTLSDLWQQHRRFGRWKAAGWIEAGVPLQPRQVALVAGPPLLGVVLLALVRRRPVLVSAVAMTAATVIDRSSGPAEDSPERLATLGAAAAVAVGWWSGMAEQVVRRLRGERLLSG